MLNMWVTSRGNRDTAVPCFAWELEQDIVRLEEEASRDDLLSLVELGGKPDHEALCKDVARLRDQDTPVSDADSDDGSEEAADEEVAKIQANALLVRQYGRTLEPGAWRGCCKSPLCDREDRHRGLCNHRATIPGPAACPEPAPVEDLEDEQGQDDSNLEDGDCEAGACSDAVMQPVEEQQLSGGHSHNCHSTEGCASGDEREVASALQTGCSVESIQHQHSTTKAVLQLETVAATTNTDLTHSHSTDDDLCQELFWSTSSSQLAAAELFSIPAAYQPRVKDLTAPSTPCLLTMDSLCDLDPPVVAAVPGEDVLVAYGSTCSDCSDHTAAKACITSSGSTEAPSSPSCASVAAAAETAVFAYCATHAMPAAAGPATALPSPAAEHLFPAETVQHVSCSPCTPDSCASTTVFNAAVAPSSDVPAATPAAEIVAVPATAAEAAAAAHSTFMDVDMVTAPVGPALSDSSAQLAAQQAAAEAVATAEAAAAAALAASGLGSSTACLAFGAQQRPPRIKSKPSNSLMKAAAIVEASYSPKSKKRQAARLAANPSNSHCCSQCGAVSTPVWRAGPAGPKTLCNACGVRYMKVAKRK